MTIESGKTWVLQLTGTVPVGMTDEQVGELIQRSVAVGVQLLGVVRAASFAVNDDTAKLVR